MEEHDRQQRLDAALGEADWTRGLTKQAVADRLAGHPDLHAAINHSLPDGTYFSTADVGNVLPADVWRTIPPAAAPSVPETGTETPSSLPTDERTGGATDRLRRVVGSGTQTVTQRTTAVAARTRQQAGSVTQAARDVSATLPERARQTATQTRDQVVNIRTRRAEPGPLPTPSPELEQGAPAGLSSTDSSVGQTFNPQPGKALRFAAVGLTLATISGLTIFILRRVVDKRRAQRHADQLKPALAGFWLMTLGLNLWSLWRSARTSDPAFAASDGTGASTPSSWSDLEATRDDRSRGSSSTSATDEYPTVGPA